MRKTVLYLSLLLSLSYLISCTRPVKHADSFYNVDDVFFNMDPARLPLIKPVEAVYVNSWQLDFPSRYIFRVTVPNTDILTYYTYSIAELDKFAVENNVIMAYSSYFDKKYAPAYIQENYYHWFVIVLDQEISKGFHTEDEFHQYIQILGISNPDWQTPDEAYEQFKQTGCLEWIPDCD